MKNDSDTIPIDFEAHKKAKAQLDQDELKQMEHDLKKIFVAAYAPESTRWRRNHTDVATWYFLWKDKI